MNQTGETAPKFLAADVHHSNPLLAPSMIGPTTRDDIYQVKYAIMVDLIRMAYGVEKDKVVGGPPWISMYRFDLKAKAPVTLTPESTRLMLKSLLLDRFHLVARPGSKPVDGYNLTAGKHLQLKRADGTGDTGCKSAMPRPADGAPAEGQILTVTCHNVTLAQLNDVVRDLPRATRAAATTRCSPRLSTSNWGSSSTRPWCRHRSSKCKAWTSTRLPIPPTWRSTSRPRRPSLTWPK
jgi:uncharacterized protein (TIGR03435 family)